MSVASTQSPNASLLVRLPVGDSQGASRTEKVARTVLRFALPIGIVGVWQALSVLGALNPLTTPSPVQVITGLYSLISSGELGAALAVSLQRAALGLLIGLSIGVSLGVLNGLSRLSEQVTDSTMQIVRLIPFIALIQLFIVWFGIGELPKIILIALACVFPVYLNTYSGVRNADQKLLEAGRVFGLKRLQLVWQVVIPAALPSILVGIRYSMGVSLLALIVAEQINVIVGIGYIINTAAAAVRPDLVMAGILVYAVLGVIVDVAMRLIEALAMPWRQNLSQKSKP